MEETFRKHIERLRDIADGSAFEVRNGENFFRDTQIKPLPGIDHQGDAQKKLEEIRKGLERHKSDRLPVFDEVMGKAEKSKKSK